MANISFKNFVDVNIQPKISREVQSTRKEVIILTDEVDTSSETFTGLTSASLDNSNFPTTNKYLTMYFKNGGISATVITGITFVKANILTALESIADKYIVIAFANSSEAENYSVLKSVAQDDTFIARKGINEKILVSRSDVFTDTDDVRNIAVKYSTIIGAEMTMAAYLSQIDVYKINSIKDYMFTAEAITAEDISNDDFTDIITRNYNVDINLQGIVRDCGGNCKDGDSLTNNYTRIVLNQTLTERLVNLLTSKLSSTDGVSKIYATIVNELEYYKSNGYLSTDKIWEYDDLVIDGITVITKGTALLSGYYVKVFPMSSLTPTQKKAHQAPPIYVIVADQYSIRLIKVDGEVI